MVYNLGSKLGLKSFFPKRDRARFNCPHINFLSHSLIFRRCIPLIFTLQELSNDIWNSKIGHMGQKLWPFKVATVGPNGPTRSSGPVRLAQLWAIFEYENAQFQPFILPLQLPIILGHVRHDLSIQSSMYKLFCQPSSILLSINTRIHINHFTRWIPFKWRGWNNNQKNNHVQSMNHSHAKF